MDTGKFVVKTPVVSSTEEKSLHLPVIITANATNTVYVQSLTRKLEHAKNTICSFVSSTICFTPINKCTLIIVPLCSNCHLNSIKVVVFL